MLWSSYPAKIDEKFRLKIPAKFRREMAETEDGTYYVTSDDGLRAQIYPIPVWERMAQKFQEAPRMDPAKLKLQKFTSYYGILTQMDPQGRILIPQALEAGLPREHLYVDPLVAALTCVASFDVRSPIS